MQLGGRLGDEQGTSGSYSDGQGEVAVVDEEVHSEGVRRRRGNGRGGVAGGRPSLFGERGGKQAEEEDAPLEKRSRRHLGSEIEGGWSSVVGGMGTTLRCQVKRQTRFGTERVRTRTCSILTGLTGLEFRFFLAQSKLR